MEFLDGFIKLMQAVSIPLAIIVAVFGLRRSGEDKVSSLTKMQVDIEYIKESVKCIPTQDRQLMVLDASCKSAHKRLDEHLRYEHGQKKEEDN